ncbi:MAG: hypothetical protein ABI134_07850, partial [Byssovorax sp.]
VKGAPPRPAAPRPAAPRPAEPRPESKAPISSSFEDVLDFSDPPGPPEPPEPPEQDRPSSEIELGARPSRGGFGEIDLMGDFPASEGFSPNEVDPDFGSQDLPAIHAPPPPKPKGRGVTRNRTMDLGSNLEENDFSLVQGGADMEAAFGDVDLPAVHSDAGLPGFPGGAMDLPARHGSQLPFHGAPRAPSTPPGAIGFGDIDLPAPPHHGGGGFGEIDLPMATDESGFPASRGREPSFGNIDLPLTFNEAALPAVASHGLPSHAAGSGLPMPSFGGSSLPMPSHGGSGLPSSAAASGLPSRASAPSLPPSMPSGELPAALQGGRRQDAYESSFGEVDLGGDAPRSSAPRNPAPASPPRSAFDDSDRAVSTTTGPNMDGAVGLDDAPAPAPVGDEVDISGSAVVEGAGMVVVERARPAAKSGRSGRARRIAILTVVALAVGGGALALEPSIGPFGVNFISDRVNEKAYATRLDELRAGVQADFDEDTAAAAKRAFTSALAAQAAVPRHRPTAAYAAYVAQVRGLRFGRRSEDDTRAAQLLTTAGADPSDALSLALAAQAAGKNELPKARQLAAELLQRSPKSVEAADLAGEVELAARAPEAAVKAWKQAAALRGDKKSARALFGLARAEMAAGNTAGA